MKANSLHRLFTVTSRKTTRIRPLEVIEQISDTSSLIDISVKDEVIDEVKDEVIDEVIDEAEGKNKKLRESANSFETELSKTPE